MLKIGHRGAKGYVAENTLASFEKAIALNVNAVELDVHASLDGVAMVIHDETIDRTTTKIGYVNDFTSLELKQLGIPSLEEVFNLIQKRCTIFIEIKDAKATEYVLQLLQKYVLEENWNPSLFQISSFNWNILEVCRSANNLIAIGVLTEDDLDKALVFAKKINAYSIHPYFKLLDLENTKQIKKNGFKIFPWTVNSTEDFNFVKSLPVDGIISDFPDRI